MVFHAFRRSKVVSTPVSPTAWKVACGHCSVDETVVWRDDQFVIMAVSEAKDASIPFAVSLTERFVVVGDVWLTGTDALWQRVGLSPQQDDLQLIAALWEQLGTDTLKLLIGMFAIVVWDRERQELWLGRDRTGSRTLYYTQTKGTRWVSPQLRSLTPHRSNDIDAIALRDYLCCAFVPGERTLWQQVKEVRPGTVLRLPDEKIHRYWQLQEHIIDAPLTWHSDRLRILLEQVVQDYLPKEPVGVFLSGGLDSSCITALAAKHTKSVHTYSIHFGEACPNELAFSSLVAKHCGTQHHILEITFKEMWARLPEVMAYLDDPIGDPLTVPNFLLGTLARQSVDVILNGEGGDPCFGGPKNQPMLMNRLYDSVSGQDALQAYLMSYHKCASDLPQLLTSEWSSVLTEPWIFSEELESDANYLNQLMALNIKFKGADQILTKVNNLTGAVGLHGRSPLFDQRIVDLSMQIPPHYKLSGVEEKAVLKQAIADLLPDAILKRPKSGMMVPVQLGFRKYWNRQARALLLGKNAAIAPYLNQALIRQWLDYEGDVWGRYGVKLWLVVSLELWLQAHGSH